MHMQTCGKRNTRASWISYSQSLPRSHRCIIVSSHLSKSPQNALSQSGQSKSTKLNIQVSLVESLSTVSPHEWNACAGDDNPFISHAFLTALEDSRSAIAREGWLPQHLLARSEESGELIGCMPLYLKGHSYGEYVFDHSWANAYMQFTMKNYYPKLQSCVPFTPVPGPRLLVPPGPLAEAIRAALTRALCTVADELEVSSAHVTFNEESEWKTMAEEGFLQRIGIQYHWRNENYTSFDDFLMSLKQSRRKSIRQERKKVAANGLVIDRRRGSELKSSDWDAFYKFYINTTDRKWGQAYLTRDFFHQLGERMGDKVLLVTATDNTNEIIAGALNLSGSTALYGRNWGCVHGESLPYLHFELCYYQAIEHAIEAKLQRVEAGAQGEHKLQRGYLPVLTYSSHYIPHQGFRTAVASFLDSEREEIEYTLDMLNLQVSPYKM